MADFSMGESSDGPMAASRWDAQLLNTPCDNCDESIQKVGFGFYMGMKRRVKISLCNVCRLQLLKLLFRDYLRSRMGRNFGPNDPPMELSTLLPEVFPPPEKPEEKAVEHD